MSWKSWNRNDGQSDRSCASYYRRHFSQIQRTPSGASKVHERSSKGNCRYKIDRRKQNLIILVLSIRNHFINYTFCIKMKSAILKNIALYAQTVFTWIMITFTHGVKEINGQKGKYLIDSVISLLLPQIIALDETFFSNN